MKEDEWKEIYLAGGCFWGLQKYIGEIPGVINTDVGYANGRTEHPSYEEVCNSNTGYAETVRVEFDQSLIGLSRILSLYFKVINPTSLNRQGNDVGSQYRTGIYYVNKEDEPVIKNSLILLQKEYDTPLAIEVAPLHNYYTAEDYHQKYLDKNPGGYCHIGSQYFDMDDLQDVLTPIQYDVTMNNATEPPFKNEYWDKFDEGIYVDITTGEPLFTSKDKFKSSCGWPSFAKPIDPEVIQNKRDHTHGMIREEVRSRVGDVHLGHIFNDGPSELGGMRYCINSASLKFIPKEKMEAEGYRKYLFLLD